MTGVWEFCNAHELLLKVFYIDSAFGYLVCISNTPGDKKNIFNGLQWNLFFFYLMWIFFSKSCCVNCCHDENVMLYWTCGNITIPLSLIMRKQQYHHVHIHTNMCTYIHTHTHTNTITHTHISHTHISHIHIYKHIYHTYTHLPEYPINTSTLQIYIRSNCITCDRELNIHNNIILIYT